MTSMITLLFKSTFGAGKVLVGAITVNVTTEIISVDVPFFLPGLYRTPDIAADRKAVDDVMSHPVFQQQEPQSVDAFWAENAAALDVVDESTTVDSITPSNEAVTGESTIVDSPVSDAPPLPSTLVPRVEEQEILDQQEEMEKLLYPVTLYFPGLYNYPGSQFLTSFPHSISDRVGKDVIRRIQVRLVRVHYPYTDAEIQAQWYSLNTDFYSTAKMQEMVVANASIGRVQDTPISETGSGLAAAGSQIALAGRIPTQKSIPRKTEESYHVGLLTPSTQSMKSTATFTSKNKTGVFSMKASVIL